MRVIRHIYIIAVIVSFVACLTGCSDEATFIADDHAEIKVETAIHAGDGTSRTRAVATVQDYVGRGVDIADSKEKEKDFESGDKITLTYIQRTENTIPDFTYRNISFQITGGSWDRTTNPDSRIYWSDAENAHTFIGYSLPDDNFKYKWIPGNGDTFYSCICDPTKSGQEEVIDFTSEWGSDGTLTIDGNDKIKKEDLLLTHDLNKKAEPGGSVAKLYFYHALANVRVIVDIRGFSASADAMDTESRVYDLVLKGMPVMYKWRQQDAKAEPLTNDDASVLPSGWNKDLKKDIKTWQPHPDGTGTNAERVFTFYALTVPGTTNLVMPFKVRYPKPLAPTDTQEKDYTARLDNVELKAGYCTTINISLNHSNEEMTVGATYIDWEFKESPDQGSLRKNSVFLDNTDRSKLTIVGDAKATLDDAVWLYNETEYNSDGQLVAKRDANGNLIIKDIYGHSGDTEDDAYQISTAQQLLSFAYEVSGGNSTTGRQTQNGVENTDFTNGGMDFSGKYIKLDADIILQPSRNSSSVDWIGIGDHNHIFNGTFLGGGRIISCLKGKSLFSELGPNAVVEYLTIQDMKDMGTSIGVLADRNAGVVNGCKVSGNMVSTSSIPIGAIVGVNENMVEACYHIGDITGNGDVAGIVGTNMGSVISCYNAGAISSGGGQCYGIIAYDPEEGMTIKKSFYNSQLAKNVTKVAPYGSTDPDTGSKPTTEMQKEDFVTILNNGLPTSSKYRYVYSPADYPKLQKY